jgi:hypothetical protein
MARIKAIYRARGIQTPGRGVWLLSTKLCLKAES